MHGGNHVRAGAEFRWLPGDGIRSTRAFNARDRNPDLSSFTAPELLSAHRGGRELNLSHSILHDNAGRRIAFVRNWRRMRIREIRMDHSA
jgi:hypothetical protein